jgi:hypothetical protein
MLADDARYSMPPLPVWYRGQDEIRAFLLCDPLQRRWRFLPTRANGQVAFGTYLWDDAAAAYIPAVSTSSPCSTDAWQKSSPSSTPTSPDSGCRSASVRRRVQNWAIGALVAATRSSGVQRHSRQRHAGPGIRSRSATSPGPRPVRKYPIGVARAVESVCL